MTKIRQIRPRIVPKTQTVDRVLEIVEAMLEELQAEAEFRPHDLDRRVLLGQRDTLTELKFRVRDETVNQFWVRTAIVQGHYR